MIREFHFRWNLDSSPRVHALARARLLHVSRVCALAREQPSAPNHLNFFMPYFVREILESSLPNHFTLFVLWISHPESLHVIKAAGVLFRV